MLSRVNISQYLIAKLCACSRGSLKKKPRRKN